MIEKDTSNPGRQGEPPLNEGPTASTLDTLAFGDEGPRVMLRNTNEDEIPRLIQLLRETEGHEGGIIWSPIAPEQSLREYQSRGGRFMVADIGDTVPVAFVMIVYGLANAEADISSLDLSEDQQGRVVRLEAVAVRAGWAQGDLLDTMIKQSLEGAAKQGYTLAMADIAADNRTAIKRLKRLGLTSLRATNDETKGNRQILYRDSKAMI